MSRRRPRVLFVGDGWLGSNARSMASGFREAGADVIHVDTTRVSLPAKYGAQWAYLKVSGRRWRGDVERLHREIEDVCLAERPDMLFCFKSVHLDQERLLALPIATKVHYSADDVSNPVNVTPEYLRTESRWDLVVTTKRHNVDEIRQRTSREPLFVWSAYDGAWHHPFPRNSNGLATLSFIGNMRPDRRQLLFDLANTYGRDLRLVGPGWASELPLRRTGAFLGDGVYGEAFSQEVARSSAHLVLLNSDNRDTHTCRSFEIPAAGGLFVGQRTPEHEEIIDEGQTGYLFSSTNELTDIIDRVRKHPSQASDVARRGYESITQGRNDYRARATTILSHLDLMETVGQ